jgi:hypothetical protein
MAITVGLACLVLVLLFARFQSGAEARIEDLSDQQRLGLYRRTLADLELCSSDAGKALAEHCVHQAKLITRFAECDARCLQLAAPWQKVPSR